jgi:hypothetical protein
LTLVAMRGYTTNTRNYYDKRRTRYTATRVTALGVLIGGRRGAGWTHDDNDAFACTR